MISFIKFIPKKFIITKNVVEQREKCLDWKRMKETGFNFMPLLLCSFFCVQSWVLMLPKGVIFTRTLLTPTTCPSAPVVSEPDHELSHGLHAFHFFPSFASQPDFKVEVILVVIVLLIACSSYMIIRTLQYSSHRSEWIE